MVLLRHTDAALPRSADIPTTKTRTRTRARARTHTHTGQGGTRQQGAHTRSTRTQRYARVSRAPIL